MKSEIKAKTSTPLVSSLLAMTLLAVGCGDKASDDRRAAERIAEAQEAELFKGTPVFTLACTGQYVLTVEGKTSTGTQSFGITIDPKQSVAHYFGFDPDGSYDSGQRKRNDEVLPITAVDADWIRVDRVYGFNRRTLKYDYSGGLASGTCKPVEPARQIPARRL